MAIKKVFLISVLLTFGLGSFAQRHHYIIEGTVDNRIDTNQAHTGPLKNGNFVYLTFGNKEVDSAKIVNGHFRFEGTSDFPDHVMISHQYGGESLFIAGDSRYRVEFTLFSPEPGLMAYQCRISTNSQFHNYREAVAKKTVALQKKRKELLTVKAETGIDQSIELAAIDQAINSLFDEVLNMPEDKLVEKTFILMLDPKFSRDKYAVFYEQLPEKIKKSTAGTRFQNKLSSK